MTPKEMGFYFPAEWAPQRATWLSLPHNEETWPELSKIWPAYFQFISLLGQDQKVCLQVNNEAHKDFAQQLLQRHKVELDNVEFYLHPTNDSWCRDHGPSFLVNGKGERLIVNWDYNCWGEKYPPFDLDNEVPVRIAEALKLDYVTPGMILEGGSVDFNGKGAVLTTESVLLNPNRNPSLSKAQIEQKLLDYFGLEQVIWLTSGIEGDDTDGHIDDITRFTDESTVVTAIETNKEDPNYSILRNNLQTLKQTRLHDGRALEVVDLPMPNAIHRNGLRLPGSYANFLICNEKVIVPVYNCPEDDVALSILEDCFPDRTIYDIDSTEIIWGLGSFHCLSQQEPS